LLEEVRLLLGHVLGHDVSPATDKEAGKELLYPRSVIFHSEIPHLAPV
jgi:hypothetical protein